MSLDTGSRPSRSSAEDASMDGPDPPRGRICLSSRPSAPRPPARLHGILDLCLRRADRGQPGVGHHHRLRPRRYGTELVARVVRGAFRQLTPPVECRGVLLLHGDPSLGQVLHGSMEREPPAHLGHRGNLLSRIGGCRVHGLPVATELRFAVDLDPGQRRHQRDRGGRLLERSELRTDAHVAHRPVTNRDHPHRGPARPARAASWHRPPFDLTEGSVGTQEDAPGQEPA